MNIKGLSDFNSEGKKNTTSYAGGEKSGLAIENPDDVKGVIEKAKKSSDKDQEEYKNSKTNCKITLYQNGFSIEGGEFRPYDTPENKKFIQELNQGSVPTELRQKYKEGLYVGLEDKRSEVYRPPTPPPPPSYIEFSGSGSSLGGGQQQQQQQQEKIVFQDTEYHYDANKPTTQIQIRFHNGQQKAVTVNLQDQILVLVDFIQRVAPTNQQFEIIAGFPPKPLTDFSQTIEQADLADSRITQKLK